METGKLTIGLRVDTSPAITANEVLTTARALEKEFDAYASGGSLELATIALAKVHGLQLLAAVADQGDLGKSLGVIAKRLTARRLNLLTLLATPVAGAA